MPYITRTPRVGQTELGVLKRIPRSARAIVPQKDLRTIITHLHIDEFSDVEWGGRYEAALDLAEAARKLDEKQKSNALEFSGSGQPSGTVVENSTKMRQRLT